MYLQPRLKIILKPVQFTKALYKQDNESKIYLIEITDSRQNKVTTSFYNNR